MLFRYPPGELINYVLESLAFSGQCGLLLLDVWKIICSKLRVDSLDSFEKHLIWQWLFFDHDPNKRAPLFVLRDHKAVTVLESYDEFISTNGPEDELSMIPTPDTQWYYLTGLGSSKRLRVQLGEFPFQLLCEISKYGARGIYSPDLCKATGQDPRSLTLRLKKLEDLGFIIKKNVYNEKNSQHTHLCVHRKFAEGEIESSNNAEDEDFDSSRNVAKLKHCIMQSLKVAPNHLRGFRDLKRELKLDKGRSSGKFFRSIVEYLHRHGYAERLMVKDPNQPQLVYCIKYVKDIPKNADAISEYVDILDGIDDLQGQEDEEYDKEIIPSFNILFPVLYQLYSYILKSKQSGITSMELIRNLTGASDYRPVVKILDSLSLYMSDGGKIKSLKDAMAPCQEDSIVRAYDFEGKFKFYRYFSLKYYEGEVNHPARIPTSNRVTHRENELLINLNRKYFQPLGKITGGTLLKGKKRKAEENKNEQKKEKKVKSESHFPNGRRGRGRPKKNETSGTIGVKPETDEALENRKNLIIDTPATKKESEHPSELTASGTQQHEVSSETNSSQRKMNIKKNAVSGSLKATKRRNELLNIIKEMGGVTYTTAYLCRKLDTKLGNSTITDKKTLARDVSLLIAEGKLEVQDISFIRSGQPINRKLLILASADLRPSQAVINLVKEKCTEDLGVKLIIPNNRRVIEGEVTIYAGAPKKVSKVVRKRKLRLQSLNEPIKENPEILEESLKEHQKKGETKVFPKEEQSRTGTLSSLVPQKALRKRKTHQKGLARGLSNYNKKSRHISFGKEDATTLFRAVVICRAFKRGAINFDQVVDLFPEMTAGELKVKWTLIRKLMGGLPAVLKGISCFENIVMRAIKDGQLAPSDLECINLVFFMDLWRTYDAVAYEGIDGNPLYKTRKANENVYAVVILGHNSQDLYEQLEDNSMRQKDIILGATTFSYQPEAEIQIPGFDKEKTVLRSIFRVSEESFSGEKVNQILSNYDDNAIKSASLELMKDKELVHFSNNEEHAKFILTERVYNVLSLKGLNVSDYKDAARFIDSIDAVCLTGKGLILSPGITSGEMAALLTLLSHSKVDMVHVDRPYRFDGYESRLIDKEKLSCDIVLTRRGHKELLPPLKSVPVPIGKPCSHIWIDIYGKVDTELYKKIIASVLYYIIFRPGISRKVLFTKLKPILGYNDFVNVMDWLSATKCIKIGSYGGYWANSNWFTILGT